MIKKQKKIFEKYKKLEVIGEGANSKVYSVKEKSTGKIFALKRIRDDTKEETNQEIEILKQIKHPNVIEIYKDFLEDENRYLLLEKADCKKLYCLGFIVYFLFNFLLFRYLIFFIFLILLNIFLN